MTQPGFSCAGAGMSARGETGPSGGGPPATAGRLAAWALVVALVYALPLLLSWARGTGPLYITDYDDRFYLARILDAYRGGSLANPFLAGHEQEPVLYPQLGERSFAGAARLLHVSPLSVVSAGLVVFPIAIFLLGFRLGWRLGLPPDYAALAGLMLVLMPSITRVLPPYSPDQLGFLRYFGGGISPDFYVTLLLAFLICLERVWTSGGRIWMLLAVVALGATFYTPPYFWSFAWGSTFLLALASSREPRKKLLAVAGLAVVLGLPTLWRLLAGTHRPEIQETLVRLDVMVPGRLPDALTTFLGFSTLGLAVLAWRLRRRLPVAGAFLLPCLLTGGLLFFQAMVTGRHLQEFHWAHCVVPLGYITLAAALYLCQPRRLWLLALAATVVFAAAVTQTGAYLRLMQVRAEAPAVWAPDLSMPQTLAWLNASTPRGSVLLAKDSEEMGTLVTFTHNKVYWAEFSGGQVMPDSEVRARAESLEHWSPEHAFPLPYRADYFLGHGAECAEVTPNALLYQNPAEHTCVAAVNKLAEK